MATMTIRTTVAFDPATAARLERLAKRWDISKSETLRRVLEKAESEIPISSVSQVPTDQEIAAMSPREAFEWLKANPQHPPGWGADFRHELREARDRDAEIEEERELEKTSLQQSCESAAKK